VGGKGRSSRRRADRRHFDRLRCFANSADTKGVAVGTRRYLHARAFETKIKYLSQPSTSSPSRFRCRRQDKSFPSLPNLNPPSSHLVPSFFVRATGIKKTNKKKKKKTKRNGRRWNLFFPIPRRLETSRAVASTPPGDSGSVSGSGISISSRRTISSVNRWRWPFAPFVALFRRRRCRIKCYLLLPLQSERRRRRRR